MPLVDAVDTPRPSVVVEVDAERRVRDITTARTVDEILSAIGGGPATIAVDAPLAVLNRAGRRDIDELLAWLDVPVFPVSRERAGKVWGGLRGEELAARAAAAPEVELFETFPDLVLRVHAWLARRGAGPTDLGAFRAEWLDLRPVPFRPKGTGRAHPRGILAAWETVRQTVDLGGWRPTGRDDWGAIADAAVIDAVLAADAAWSVCHGHGVVVATSGARVALPTVAALAERITVNVDRLAREGRTLRVEPSGVQA